MPFYEYQCRACGELTEVLQKVSDAPLRKCPSCGKNQLEKLISAPVFRLKGGGWYETDFKSDQDNKRNLVGADKDETPAKSDAKPETKEAAKAEPPAADKDKKADSGDGAKKSDKPAAKPVATKKRAVSRAKKSVRRSGR